MRPTPLDIEVEVLKMREEHAQVRVFATEHGPQVVMLGGGGSGGVDNCACGVQDAMHDNCPLD